MTLFQDNLAHIQAYLATQHVLGLCVVDDDGYPWCASCYYAFDPALMILYLMSDVQTRHGAIMARRGQVAGTIAGQTKCVEKIRGVQYQGWITLLQGEDALSARARYLRRFPIARGQTAPLWGLALQQIKMTDNQLGFGHKLHWQRVGDPTGSARSPKRGQ